MAILTLEQLKSKLEYDGVFDERSQIACDQRVRRYCGK
jgi:exonuclease VII large subunit